MNKTTRVLLDNFDVIRADLKKSLRSLILERGVGRSALLADINAQDIYSWRAGRRSWSVEKMIEVYRALEK